MKYCMQEMRAVMWPTLPVMWPTLYQGDLKDNKEWQYLEVCNLKLDYHN